MQDLATEMFNVKNNIALDLAPGFSTQQNNAIWNSQCL